MELGVLICSRVNACDYCLQHHTPLAHAPGLGKEQLQCIERGDWGVKRDLWSEQEWLVIRYAEQLTGEPYKIRDELFTELHRFFDDGQIVEMTMRFALCSAWNKFNDALGLDTEAAFRQAYDEIMVADRDAEGPLSLDYAIAFVEPPLDQFNPVGPHEVA